MSVNANLFYSVLLLIAVLAAFTEIILLFWGKRIIRNLVGLYSLLQFGLLLYSFCLMMDYRIPTALVILAGIVILWLYRYYRGIKYNIFSDNQEILVTNIETGIREIEGTQFEKVVKDNKIIFLIPETNKTIQLIQREPVLVNRKSHDIIFKKWRGHESRRGILSSIQESLLEDQGGKIGKLNLVLQFILMTVAAVVAIGLISKFVMEPERLPYAVLEEPPVKAYFVETDHYSSGEEVLEIHEHLQDVYTSIIYGEHDEGRLKRMSEIILYYGPEENFEGIGGNEDEFSGRRLYIGKYSGYLFVPTSEIGNKSFLHKILWKIHQIYDKEEGQYYFVSTRRDDYNSWNVLVEDILSTNRDHGGDD